jgi:hypothetical protein
MTTRLLRLATVTAACALLAGCVQMPTSGPVEEAQVNADAEEVPGISYDPRPPQDGDGPLEIVRGFLEAMRATPITAAVARQYLSTAAASTWVPEQEVLTYGELGTAAGDLTVEVPLKDVNTYDARGAWQGTRADDDLVLGLVQEDGEWRIDEVPDALIVPDTWFDEWYQRASLYYFDPTSEVLVPEPVFMPRGDPFASSLVRALLVPLGEDAQDVVRTYFPPGTTHGVSVPITSGVAQVSLAGDPDAIDVVTARRMIAQLVWTVRQDDRIRALELTVGGRSFSLTPGSTQVGMSAGESYDPNGSPSDGDMFALEDGRVVTGTLGAFRDTNGPLGGEGYDVRSVGASVDGSRVAAVTGDGTGLYVAPTQSPGAEVQLPVSGAVDLAQPHWDLQDRIWVLDRGKGAARVVVVTDGTARAVLVPGLTGNDVRKLLVSRDGTRLVAVVRARDADRVVSARVRHDESGAIIGFTPFRRLSVPTDGSPRIRDIGWRSPTSVSVLNDLGDDISQVRTVSVDGSPREVTTGGATRLRGPNRILLATPVAPGEAFALAGRVVNNLTHPEVAVADLPKGLTSLTYVG